MKKQPFMPKPLFGTLDWVLDYYKQCQHQDSTSIIKAWLNQCLESNIQLISSIALSIQDYRNVLYFLYSYRGSQDTFNSYRRELERFLQWAWFVQKKNLTELKRLDIEAFIEFCKKPDKAWVGTKIVARFINKNGTQSVNPEWRPFIAKVSKKAFHDGLRAKSTQFELSQQGIKVIFAVTGSFYNYLIQEEMSDINPVTQIRQKSKFIRKKQSQDMIRRLSDVQWEHIIDAAYDLAKQNPEYHERTLFIMTALYSMYLRISELAANERWSPKMNHFFRDTHNNWWFKTVGKGNKERQIAVSLTMLTALKRWRKHLLLTALPSIDDQSPLIPKTTGKGPITSTRAIRNIVQICFNVAIQALNDKQLKDEADMLRSATVHWLRHTGISVDVQSRPREHVRDDAGHGSSAITDRYIDVELQERAKSARSKKIIPEDGP